MTKPTIPRPNILYIHSHDTGRRVSPYGAAELTPRIQALAEGGVVFRQAFSAAPTCSPSRAALLTGQTPHEAGMLGLTHRGWALHDYRQHLLHTLRAAGYTSALAGVQHIAPGGVQGGHVIGYDRVLDVATERAEHVAPAAAAFLRAAPEPFFLDAGFVETHLLPGPGAFGHGTGDPRYVAPPPALPDTPRVRQDLADYRLALDALDAGVGQVLDALDAAGLAERTLVILTTDHGLPLPGGKGQLSDHGLGVMLLLRGPGGFTGGRVLDALTSQLDVFPTLCDLLELPRPEWLRGTSLLPLVRGEAEAVNGAIFAETTHHAAYEAQRAIRTTRHKLILRFGDRTRPVLPNVDDSRSKDEWVEGGWRERPVPGEALFDLLFDPQERRNLADDPAYAGVRADLRARLLAWMRETNDPLLHGPVPVPPGTLVKDPDGLSPKEPGWIEGEAPPPKENA